ncbi:cyanophycinase [Rhodocaloribacter sp.]
MMKHLSKLFLAIVPVFLLVPGVGAQSVGPAHGALLLAGGGVHDPAIYERFIALAGGPDAPIVVIPTAGGADDYGPDWPGTRVFEHAGATHVTVLHTYDPEVADTDAFVEPLRAARGVWFTGGRQWRLADAYLGTKVHEELWKLLERGGVIGGSSAGATIQGSYLARGDTQTNTVMMGDHEEGLGFLKNTAVDQHVLRRNRHFDLLEIIEARPELLGLGLDEDTAIVVRGDRFEVIGRHYVAVYDHTRMLDSGGPFYFLAPGDTFDLATRTAYRPGEDGIPAPFDRVVDHPWSNH